ncbi:hypothetical protein QEH59_07575 [Coraliomargarita sp. SDUM461004]|uniref:FAD-binding domain-containing protein n=1 Tax=Thalassobacterium sedimentorum TaxID=3041258 RepID=A0ABU1AHR6_9BACT|nr:hypothetical protein [Coraliomargarita sp. SDUM461004]MDQ8194279.1 hypothetical protein [Coraliomargarita sp. SDUM461004]
MKPIEIIGAGLAGLALGNALQANGIPVTLHEAGTLPRHRVCGEFICGRGSDALHSLGLGTSLRDACTHKSTVWYLQGRARLRQTLPKPALGLSRYVLDQRLADSFQETGGQLILKSRKKLNSRPIARVHCQGRKPARSDWVGLKLHCQDLPLEADLELHLGTSGYVGLSKIENNKVNVCALFKQRSGLKAKRTDYLLKYLKNSKLGYVAEKLCAATILPESHCGVAGVEFSRIPSSDSSKLFLGDAYSVIPPFTGNGMSIALEAAELAYPMLYKYATGTQTWQRTVNQINLLQHARFDSRLRAARWLHPWIHSKPGQYALGTLARTQLLPFKLLYSITH